MPKTMSERIDILRDRSKERGYVGRLAEQKLRELGTYSDVSAIAGEEEKPHLVLVDEEHAELVQALARLHDPEIDHDVELPEHRRIYTTNALDLLALSNIYWKDRK